jgi:hypothetical protein
MKPVAPKKMRHLNLQSTSGPKVLLVHTRLTGKLAEIMIFMMKPSRNAALWWVSALTFALGISVYVLLKPTEYDMQIQRYRSIALVSGILISGFCVIIGTSKRWFGKGL